MAANSNRIDELINEANTVAYAAARDDSHRILAQMVIDEHLKLLRQEWYTLNNAPSVEGESLRDVGMRVGSKTEVARLLNMFRKHWGLEGEHHE